MIPQHTTILPQIRSSYGELIMPYDFNARYAFAIYVNGQKLSNSELVVIDNKIKIPLEMCGYSYELTYYSGTTTVPKNAILQRDKSYISNIFSKFVLPPDINLAWPWHIFLNGQKIANVEISLQDGGYFLLPIEMKDYIFDFHYYADIECFSNTLLFDRSTIGDGIIIP